jgi:hypothetical protein
LLLLLLLLSTAWKSLLAVVWLFRSPKKKKKMEMMMMMMMMMAMTMPSVCMKADDDAEAVRSINDSRIMTGSTTKPLQRKPPGFCCGS